MIRKRFEYGVDVPVYGSSTSRTYSHEDALILKTCISCVLQSHGCAMEHQEFVAIMHGAANLIRDLEERLSLHKQAYVNELRRGNNKRKRRLKFARRRRMTCRF